MGKYMSECAIWFSVGIILIIIEFIKIPGIGLLFLGLGAITTSISLYYLPKTVFISQFSIFGISSLSLFILLWYPIKVFMKNTTNNSDDAYIDVIGSTAKVINNNIMDNSYGQVLWSGTVMNAKFISSRNSCYIKVGEYMTVISIKGNVLTCTETTPKKNI